MARYEYIKLALSCIRNKIVDQYNLRSLSSDGWVYLEIRKGMPGLKQAVRIANDRIKAYLAHFGFTPVPRTTALWKYTTKPITFSLLKTLESSMLARRTPTTLSKFSKNCTPSPSTGTVPSSVDLPLPRITPHSPVTYPFPTISRQPYINSNILRPNTRNMPPTTGQNPTMVCLCNMQCKKFLLLSCPPKPST